MDNGERIRAHIRRKSCRNHVARVRCIEFAKWTGLQAVYRSLLHLSWVDKLVDNIKTIFVDLYGDQLKKPHTTIVECHFDEYFDQQIQQLEKTTLGQDTRALSSSELHQESHLSLVGNPRDEPPPLPGLRSRGSTIFRPMFSRSANIKQSNPEESPMIQLQSN